MIPELIIQGIGFLGVFCTIISVQFNTHYKIIIFKTLSELFFAIQMLLLGSYTGVVVEIIGIIRNIVFTYAILNKKSVKPWIITFVLITLILGTTTTILSFNLTLNTIIEKFTNYTLSIVLVCIVTILPMIAKTLSCISYAMKDPHKLRMLNLPSNVCWIVHDSIMFSIAGILCNVFNIVSITIAEMRYKKIKKESGSY